MVTVPRLLLQSCVLCRTTGELSSNYWTLQALACDVLPPTTAVIDHVIGLEKRNWQPPDSFSLERRWQQVCNRQLRLYQAFLL